MGLTPWLPLALPHKQLHVAVYVESTATLAAGRTDQVIQLLDPKAKVQLTAAVLISGTSEGVRADATQRL